jgi:ABC-2 type transport system permease protein
VVKKRTISAPNPGEGQGQMKKLWAVIVREYMERVRTRWFVVATVFGPLFFGALMYLPAYVASRGRASVDVARIRILDATATNLGRAIATELNGGVFGDSSRTQVIALAPQQLPAAESTATRAVLRNEIRGYLVLDSQTLAGRTARYAGTNATAFSDMRRIETAVTAEVLAERLRAAGVAPADATVLKRMRLDLHAERVTPSGRGGSGQINVLIAITVAMLLYVTIFIYGQNVLRGVIEEKQTRVAEIVVSSVPATTLLAGKVLGVGAVGLTQLLIWMAASVGMARYRAPLLAQMGVNAAPLQFPTVTNGQIALLILFFVLGYTFYAALFAAVGAMVSSEQEAQQAQLPVVLLLVVSIMFLQPVLNAPEGALAMNLSWIPFSSPIVMPLRMSAVNVPGWEVGLSLFGLAASCYIAVYVAAKIYRTGLLMYGKRPSLIEVFRWVRQAR